MHPEWKSRFARSSIFGAILWFSIAVSAQCASAATINVKIDNGILTFSGGPPSKAYKMYNHAPNTYAGGEVASGAGTTDASGNSSGTPNVTGMNGTFEIAFAGDNFVGIVNGGTYTSRQEQVDLSLNQFRGDPVLISSFSSFASVGGSLTDQFNLINSSTAYPLNFTDLTVYKGLDLSYFTASNFDSAAAIASGTFVTDLVTDSGGFGIPVAGGVDIPEVSIPVSNVVRGTYQLVVGTAEPYLGNGMFGPSFAFSLASAPVPEPASWTLMFVGFCGLGAIMRRRRTSATAV
jgi:hypothetical protein